MYCTSQSVREQMQSISTEITSLPVYILFLSAKKNSLMNYCTCELLTFLPPTNPHWVWCDCHHGSVCVFQGEEGPQGPVGEKGDLGDKGNMVRKLKHHSLLHVYMCIVHLSVWTRDTIHTVEVKSGGGA